MCGRSVFIDIDSKTYNLDVEAVEKQIIDRTKAIAPVDFTGQPVDIDAFMELAKKHDLIVIQDGAHSLGATYKDERVRDYRILADIDNKKIKIIIINIG